MRKKQYVEERSGYLNEQWRRDLNKMEEKDERENGNKEESGQKTKTTKTDKEINYGK